MKLALVNWVDSFSKLGWHPLDEPRVAHCVSVGMLVSENAECVKLALSYDPDIGNVGDTITIPKVAITQIRHLGVVAECTEVNI